MGRVGVALDAQPDAGHQALQKPLRLGAPELARGQKLFPLYEVKQAVVVEVCCGIRHAGVADIR